MTIVAAIMALAFGFLTWRHISNGRYFWALLTGFGLLIALGSIWVDYMRATGGKNRASPTTEALSSQSAPVIGDYKPAETGDAASEPAATN